MVWPEKSGSCSGKLQNTHNHRCNHGQRRGKWPPNAPNEASSPRKPSRMDGWQLPEQAVLYFVGSEGVYGHQSTPLFRRWCIATTSDCFEGHTPPQPLQIYALTQGVFPHQAITTAWGTRPHVGCKGAISASGSHGRLWLRWSLLTLGGWWCHIF